MIHLNISELKQKCSVINLSLREENLQSAVEKAMQKYFVNVIGREATTLIFTDSTAILPTKTVEDTTTLDDGTTITLEVEVPTEREQQQAAVIDLVRDYAERALINFAIADSIVYLMTRVSNDGVTVKKNDDETTLYKYQQDQLEKKLLDDAHFWYAVMIKEMTKHPQFFNFTDYQSKARILGNTALVNAFELLAGVQEHSFFLMQEHIITQAWRDICCSRGLPLVGLYGEDAAPTGILFNKQDAKDLQTYAIPEDIKQAATEAVVYETMARVAEIGQWQYLPTSMRDIIYNEMRKGTDGTEQAIRKRQQQYYKQLADGSVRQLDYALSEKISKAAYNGRNRSGEQKFVLQ